MIVRNNDYKIERMQDLTCPRPGHGDLNGSIAAASMLVLAAFGVLVAVRFLHWGRALDIRSLG